MPVSGLPDQGMGLARLFRDAAVFATIKSRAGQHNFEAT